MLNVEARVDGKVLTLIIDLSQRHGLSKSGKTHTIASTNGFSQVVGHPEVAFSLNVNARKK